MTESTDRVQRLQRIFDSLGADPTFTERQVASRGSVREEGAVTASLTDVVAEMRERYRFRTSLDDAALAAVVRGYYAGRSDAALAAELDVSTAVVARARVNLHLLRPVDILAPFDLGVLQALLAEGVTHSAAATVLGVSRSTVDRYAHVLSVRAEARETGYRYPEAFEERLAVAEDATLAATYLSDRRTMEAVVD